jgi:hypothetical protein
VERQEQQRDQQGDTNRRKIPWHTIGRVLQLSAALAAVIAILVTAWTFERGRDIQALIAASDTLQNHYEFAANQGVGLGENVSEGESELVAQHGLRAAHFIFDATEETAERRQWRNTAGGLLERYEETIDKADFPCEELDNEFVEFAEGKFGVHWCRCQGDACEEM